MAVTRETLADAIALVDASMPDLTDVLNAADAKLGDGDTGTMLARLFRIFAAVDVRNAENLSAGFLALAKAGAASTGSSLGTLIITAMMTASKATSGRSELAWTELSGLVVAIRDAVMARGKAELGAKTIIDGFDALAIGLAGKTDAASAAAAAEKAMDAVLNEFRNRPSGVGRARMFAEKSVGLDDPGMLALAAVVRSLAKNAQHGGMSVA